MPNVHDTTYPQRGLEAAEDMEAFDRLPYLVRRRLARGLFDLSSPDVLEIVQSHGDARAVEAIGEAERAVIAADIHSSEKSP